MAAAWCSSSVRANPAPADAALVAGVLGAWCLACVAVLDPAARPAFLLAAFATAAFAAALYRRDRLRAWHVLALGVALRAWAFALPPVLSDDVYRYVWDGLVQVRGVNPYAFTPRQLVQQMGAHELLPRFNSPDYYSVYPPVSQGLFWLAGWAGERGGILAAFATLKLATLAADLGILLLLLRQVPPRRALLWAAMPFVVMETTGQVHTDVWGAFALVAACALERPRPLWSGVLLAAAAWVKLVPGLVAPVLLMARRYRAALGFGAALVLLTLPFAAPYVLAHVRESLDLYVRRFEFNAGPYLALKALGYELTGQDQSKLIGPLLRGAFLLALPLIWLYAIRHRWGLARATVAVYGLFLATATTVHPWYLIPVLALLPLAGRPGWSWQALGLMGLATYWFYTGGPLWPFVWLGWGAWLVLEAARIAPEALTQLMRARARTKLRRLDSVLGPVAGHRVLDLGAGEGFVGEHAQASGAWVTLSDVENAARVPIPALSASTALPFAPGAFDDVFLVYVLHHAADPVPVLREALRVGRRVVVLESVYQTQAERSVLAILDGFANRIRGPWMESQPAPVFRTVAEWTEAFEALGQVRHAQPMGRPPHRQALFVIEPLLQC